MTFPKTMLGARSAIDLKGRLRLPSRQVTFPKAWIIGKVGGFEPRTPNGRYIIRSSAQAVNLDAIVVGLDLA